MLYVLTYEASYSPRSKLYTCTRSIWESKERFAFFTFTTNLDTAHARTDLANWLNPDGTMGQCGPDTFLDRLTPIDQARTLLANSSIGYLKKFRDFVLREGFGAPRIHERSIGEACGVFRDDLVMDTMHLDDPDQHKAFQALIYEFQENHSDSQ